MTQRRLWTSEQDQVISALVYEHGTKKWTLVADEMKKIVSLPGRTSKQIRERYKMITCRWHNHLDPSVNKKQWTSHEESILFESHRQLGSKWKQIANRLQGRTDNHIKNYFYSTMRRALRRVNKFLGSKNSTTQMRTIRPSILSFLLDIADSDPEIRSLVNRILVFSKFKPTRSAESTLFVDEQKQSFQSAINKLMEINQIYTKKGIRKFEEFEALKAPEKLTEIESVQQKYEEDEYLQSECVEVQNQYSSEGAEKSWTDQHEENYNHQLPDIEKPEYECELLVKKQQHLDPNNHIQFMLTEPVWNMQVRAGALIGEAMGMLEF